MACHVMPGSPGSGPALAADMKHRLGIPYRKISQLYELAFGLDWR